jgi:CBS domain-containing protein
MLKPTVKGMESGVTWIVAVNERAARVFCKKSDRLEPVRSLLLTEETSFLKPYSGDALYRKWQMSFSNAVCTFLNKAAEQQMFDSLVLIAASAMMDCLQSSLGKKVKERISAEVTLAFPILSETSLKAVLPGILRHIPLRGPYMRDEALVESSNSYKRRKDMQSTQVKDLMEKTLVMANPDDTLEEASRKMKENDCGYLPVGTEDKLAGVITDRDIVVRAIAGGADPVEEKVRDYMTTLVHSCHAEDTLAQAAETMHENNVSRLVVLDEKDKVCGILSFGRILRDHDDIDEVKEIVASATGKKMPYPQEKGAPSPSPNRVH